MFRGSKLQKAALLLALIFVASAVLAGVIFAVQYGSTGFSSINFNSENTKNSIKVDQEKVEALQGIDSISIEDVSEDIKLIPVDTNDVKAHFYGSYSSANPDAKPELIVERSGSTLKIKAQVKPNKMVINFRSNLALDVYIPKEFSGNLQVKSISGEITADELILESFVCNTTSGNLTAERIDAKKARLDTTSGEMKINGNYDNFSFNSTSGNLNSDNFTSKTSIIDTTSGEAELSGNPGDVTAKAVSGNLTFEYTAFSNNIEAGTTSGEVTIKLPENASFLLDFDTTSGDVECAFPVTVTDGKRRNDLKGTVGSGEGSVYVKTVSGSLTIQK